MHSSVEIPLDPALFGPEERELVSTGPIRISGFLYPSGVAALRVTNGAGEMIILPFHGQQIWDATFLGRRLTMESLFEEPRDTFDYLGNYGGLLLHCGAASMGNPGPGDTHPLHGELPNARYGNARIRLEFPESGPRFTLSGSTRQTRAFGYDYLAHASLELAAGATSIAVRFSLENLQARPMGLLYLGHVNFRPATGGRFIDTIRDDVSDALLRTTPPAEPVLSPAQWDASSWTGLTAPQARAVPAQGSMAAETVMMLRLASGQDGLAHAAQLHPDGTADFVSYRPGELPFGVRWVVRNGCEDAAGFLLPSTAYPDGLGAAKRRGQLVVVPPGEVFRCSYDFGVMDAAAAKALAEKIEMIRRSPAPA